MHARGVVIVGAGVVGLLTALELAGRAREVTLLEAREPGAGASTRNAGVLHVIQPPPGRARRRLAHEGRKQWPGLLEKLVIEYHRTRLVIPAFTPREEAMLPLLALALRLLSGGERVRLAGAGELRRLEPLLAPGARRGVVVEGYMTLDPARLVKALAGEVETAGVGLEPGVEVSRLECGRESVTMHTSRGTYEARVVVNAAGAGAARLAGQAGVEAGITLAPGSMTLHDNPGVESIVAWFPRGLARETKGGAVIPWPGGNLVLGPTLARPGEEPHGPEQVVERYRGLLSMDPGPVRRHIVGYRTVYEGRDFLLVRGRGGCRRTVHALGIESPGLTAAPAIASRLAAMALEELSG